MAKKCMQRRELKRLHLAKKYVEERRKLRQVINNPEVSSDSKELAQAKLSSLPRDSSKGRQGKRCWITGRVKGVYRRVGICRNMFRVYAMQGDIPGLHKASW